MLWECLGCSTQYAWDLQACPHCGSTEREDAMAKISRLRGPSDARDPELSKQTEVRSEHEPETVEPPGGEQPSPGTSSEASTRKTQPSSKKNAAPRRGRARTTASPSSPDPEVSTTAPGVTTSTSATGGSSDAE